MTKPFSWNRIKETIVHFKDLGFIGSSNIFSTAILAGFWLYIASIVDVESYGEIGYLIGIASIGSVIGLAGATNTLVVYTAKGVNIQSSMFVISFISSAAVAVVLFFLMYNSAVSVYVIGSVIFSLITSELLGKKLYKTFSKYNIINRVLIVIFALAFYYFLGPDGIILGMGFSYLIFAKRIHTVLKQSKFSFSSLKPYRGFILNSYGTDITSVLTGHLDKLIIFPIFGFLTLGNYYLAMQFFAIAMIIPGTVFQYVLPKESSGESLQNLKKATIFFSIGITALVIFLAPLVLPVLFPQFSDAVEMIQIMVLSAIPHTISAMSMSKLLSKEKSKLVITGSLIFIAIQVTAIISFAGMFGSYGIAYAFLLAHSTSALYFYVAEKKVIK